MVVFRWFLFYWIGVMIGIIWVDLCKGLNLYHLFSIRWILMGIRSWGSAKHYHERHKFNRSYLNYKQVESLFNEVGLKVEDWYAPTLFRGLKVSSRIVKNKLFLALSFTI